jgi:hypothetical protein
MATVKRGKIAESKLTIPELILLLGVVSGERYLLVQKEIYKRIDE